MAGDEYGPSVEGPDDPEHEMAGETAWDIAYWCSAHQIAHTARQLIEEHNTAPSGAGERDVLRDVLDGIDDRLLLTDHETWAEVIVARLAARGYTLSRSEPDYRINPAEREYIGLDAATPPEPPR